MKNVSPTRTGQAADATSFSPPETFPQSVRDRFPEAFRSNPPMLTGTILPQWVRHTKRHGAEVCRCRSGSLHGPYHYLFQRTAHGKLRKRYIRKQDVEAVRLLCRQYQQMRALCRENRRQWQETYQQAGRLCRLLEHRRKAEGKAR